MIPAALLPYQLPAPEHLRHAVASGEEYPGECYATALYFLHETIEARLVHGTVRGFNGRIAHAWVELAADVIFDGTLQAFFQAAGYRRVLQAQEEHSYGRTQALLVCASSGTGGPWTDADRQAAARLLVCQSA